MTTVTPDLLAGMLMGAGALILLQWVATSVGNIVRAARRRREQLALARRWQAYTPTGRMLVLDDREPARELLRLPPGAGIVVESGATYLLVPVERDGIGGHATGELRFPIEGLGPDPQRAIDLMVERMRAPSGPFVDVDNLPPP